jgi:hypothetical protein
VAGGRVGRVAFQPVGSLGRALRQSLKNPEGRAPLPAIPSTGVGRKPRVEFVFGGDGPYSPSPGYARWRGRGMPADRTITQESSDLVSEDEIGQAGNLFHDFQIYFRPADRVIVGKEGHNRKLM